jgi:hypothetical protein
LECQCFPVALKELGDSVTFHRPALDGPPITPQFNLETVSLKRPELMGASAAQVNIADTDPETTAFQIFFAIDEMTARRHLML